MKWILEKNGFNVVRICATGEEAIQKATELKPDLILMDIVLQGEIDGIEAAKIIYGKHKIPIVFCTANCDTQFTLRMNLIEHEGIISKPFEDRILLRSLQTIQNREGAN
jgi:CheY-like chemotaxis protein